MVEIAIRDENQNYAVDNIPSERLEDEENLNLPEGCILETRPMETVQAGRPTDTSREMDVEDNLVVDTTEEGEHEPDYEAHSKMMNDVEQCQENGKLAVPYNRLENLVKVPARGKKKMHTSDYDLGCFMLWWRRMEREGAKEKYANDLEKARKKSANAISAFLTKISPKNSENTHCNSEKVISERSLDLSLLQKSGTDSYMEGGGGRGFKRSSSSNTESPSKRSRNFDDLVTFFGGSAGVVHVPKDNSANILTTCLMNTTLRTRQIRGTQTKTLPATDYVEGDESGLKIESFPVNDPNFGAEG